MKQEIQFWPFQFKVGGHSQIPELGPKNWPWGQETMQAVPFHILPAPQSIQVLSVVKYVPSGQAPIQVPLYYICIPAQSWQMDPTKRYNWMINILNFEDCHFGK